MKHYVSPDVEIRDFESEAPLAASGSNEGFGNKPGFYELLKPFVILLFAGLLASCDPETQTGRLGSGFTATLETQKTQTRTSLDGTAVLWSAGDTISVYKTAEPAAKGEPFGLDPAGIGGAEGLFTSETHNDWTASACYALYPAAMDGGLTGSTLTVNLPAGQQPSSA